MDVDEKSQNYIPDEIFRRCKTDPKQFQVLDPNYLEEWNAHIQSLVKDERVIDAVEKFCYYIVNEQVFKDVLIVCKLSPTKPYIDVTDITTVIDNTVVPEYRVRLLQSLSILELSLVIAMMHGQEIFDGQPMNFEMVLHRYTKFANANSSTQTVPRPVVLKAFEHLQRLELVAPVQDGGGPQYRLYTLAAPADDVRAAVRGARALPTEIAHWCNNSIV